jgi:hypothetical protein
VLFNNQNLTNFFFLNRQISIHGSNMYKNIKTCLKYLFSYLPYSQIWLNIHGKNCQFWLCHKVFNKNIGDDTLSQFLFSTLTFAKTKKESLL